MPAIIGADNKQYASHTDTAKYKRESGSIDNPKGTLDSDAFLKLFIESLKNQSINSTTDIKEIMQYTASMTTVQTNTASKEALEKVVEKLGKDSDYKTRYSVLPAIGKMAITKLDTLKFDGKQTANFSMYAQKPMKDAVMEITNISGAVVKQVSLKDYVNFAGTKGEDDNGVKLDGASGLLKFSWDGTLANGKVVDAGDYNVKIHYKDPKGRNEEINMGEYKVQSVKFKDGEAYLNVGSFDVALKDILELKESSL